MRTLREIIHSKYNCKCAYCGCEITIKEMQVDHIIPKKTFRQTIVNNHKVPSFLTHLTEFDVEHIDNKNPACRVCNKWKDAFDLELFRSELSEQLNRLNKYSASYRIAKKYGLIEEKTKKIKFYFEHCKGIIL